MKVLHFSILVCLTAFAGADVIIDEDFESGVLPSGWQIWEYGVTGAIEWEICYVGQYTYMPDPAHSGTHYAWHDDGTSSSPMSDSWLVTDTYDLSTYDNVFGSFWRYAKYPASYDYTGVYYATVASPGPGDFIEIDELGPDNFNVWFEFAGDLNAECAGEANVTLAWLFKGQFAHVEAIDDIFLEALTTALDQNTWGAIKSAF